MPASLCQLAMPEATEDLVSNCMFWERAPGTTALPQPAAAQRFSTPLQRAPLSCTEHQHTPQEGWALETKVFTLGTEKEMKVL